MTILCPECRGKRYVFNAECLLGGPIFAPMIAFLERLDPFDERDMSRKKCPVCRGRGKVTLNDD